MYFKIRHFKGNLKQIKKKIQGFNTKIWANDQNKNKISLNFKKKLNALISKAEKDGDCFTMIIF